MTAARRHLRSVPAPLDDTRRRARNERTRRYRQRQHSGMVMASTPVSDEITGMLIDLGWLPEAESEDRREIGLAIFRMLTEAAKNR
jgi:hypothetical protein